MGRFIRAILEEFKADNGWSSSILFIPTFSICAYERSMTHLLSATGASTAWELIWGFVLLILFLTYRAYGRLDEAFGSREIIWSMEPQLNQHPNDGHWYFRGSIYNGDKMVEEAHVRLMEFKDSSGAIVVQPMNLQLRGGGTIPMTTLYNGGNLNFDVARVSGHASSQFEFLGFENMFDRARGSAGPGRYELTLRLLGRDFKSRDYSVKIQINPGGGQNAIDLLGVSGGTKIGRGKLVWTITSVIVTVFLVGGLWYMRRKNPPPPPHNVAKEEADKRRAIRDRLAEFEETGNKLMVHLREDPPGNESKFKASYQKWYDKTAEYLKANLEKSDYVRFTNEHSIIGVVFFRGISEERNGLYFEIRSRIEDLDKMIDANK